MVDVKSEAPAVDGPFVDPRDRYTMEIKFSRNPRSGENQGEVKSHYVAPDLDLSAVIAAQGLQAQVLVTMQGWGVDALNQMGIPLPGAAK